MLRRMYRGIQVGGSGSQSGDLRGLRGIHLWSSVNTRHESCVLIVSFSPFDLTRLRVNKTEDPDSPCSTHRNRPATVFQLPHLMHSQDWDRSIDILSSIHQRSALLLRSPCLKDEEEGTYHQNMSYSVFLIPTLLEGVNTDFSCFRNIWMEDTGHHSTYQSAPPRSRAMAKVRFGGDIHLGGRLGYSGPNSNRTRKYPPS
jgi:hypothetical protein